MWNESGYGGGGYMTSSGPGNMASPGAHGSPATRNKEKKLNNIFPCSISQVLNIPDDGDTLRIGEVEATMFSVVGKVQSVEKSTTNTTYVVDDMTGPQLTIRRWIDSSEEENDDLQKVIEVGQYIKATGAMRNMQGKKHMMALNITTLSSFNELTMHLLEIIHARLMSEKTNQMSHQDTFGNRGGMNMDSAGGSLGFSGSGLDKIQQAVHDVIRAVETEEGCELGRIIQTLKTFSKDSIKQALEFLSSEGHIYTTYDDEHFKST